MEETGQDKEVSNKSEVSLNESLDSLLNELSVSIRNWEKSEMISKRNSEISERNRFLEGETTSEGRKNSMKPLVVDCKRRSRVSRENAVRDWISKDDNTESPDLVIRNFEADNNENSPTDTNKPCDAMICGIPKTSEGFIYSKYSETLNSKPNCKTVTSTCTAECLDAETEADTTDTDESSSDCNSQTSTTAVIFSANDSNTPYSYLEIPERDSFKPDDFRISDQSLRKFQRFKNKQNYSDFDFMDCNSGKSNVFYRRMRNRQKPSSVLTTDKNLDQQELDLNFYRGSNTVSDCALSGSNPKPVKMLKFSDSNSESSSSALNFSNSESETCDLNVFSSDGDQESNSDKQSLDNKQLEHLEVRHPNNNTAESQDSIQKVVTLEAFSDIELTSGDDRGTSVISHETMKKNACTDYTCGKFFLHKLDVFLDNAKSALSNLGSEINPTPKATDRGSKSYQSGLKASNAAENSKLHSDQVLQIEQNHQKEEEMRGNTEDSARDSNNEISTSVETEYSDPDALVDIFKTVIKCHPIKKFEIPPYEFCNADAALETTRDELENASLKDPQNAMQMHDTDKQRNILESFSCLDSHSSLFFEKNDCFRENSFIICDALRKEYLHIAAKINLELLKETKDLAVEDYELRMCNLNELDDELGYVSAKLITTVNDWVKQFYELSLNCEQCMFYSRELYHMSMIRICVLLGYILLKLCLEKQLILEGYENSLMFYRKLSN